ncbi:Sec-independent protein translocase protein TatB [Ancylobacter pratisalsi]|uniref:Sec-independent protein translocase protein TatB n=1 Tax=Ancylobacter pratisalsi TaxID=1745854 RepID=A0A6P1YS67_9HYPH|nr:Sec-independent protein translocase protein TatB [Ancylobacter pratisalsi]QIB35631.1 twin-arginine translocase subunit TatB [Ancylobacter pratisalsi]
MFDIGWSELLVVGIIALIVIGPKELPRVLRTLGQSVGKLRRMAGEFQGQFNEALREAELSDLKDGISGLKSEISGFATDAQKSISGALPSNPLHDIDDELKNANQPVERADLPAPGPGSLLPEPSELEPYAFEDVEQEVKAAAAKLDDRPEAAVGKTATTEPAATAPAKPKRARATKSPASEASASAEVPAKPKRAPRVKALPAEPEVAEAVASLDDTTPPSAAKAPRKPRVKKTVSDEAPAAPSTKGKEGPAA